MFQFIHAADIHLDSPLRGLTRYEGAPVERIQSASRDALSNLVQLAIDERVAFVLIAGDLWDGDWPDSGPGLFFISQAVRLGKAGIPVYVVKGNHDAQSQLTTAIRHWPDNVTIFPHRKPHTETLDKWNAAIHGQSYANQQTTEDLSSSYPPPVPGMFNIGILHTSLDDGGTDYAPASIDGLVGRGYHYWALGHVHVRQELSRDGVHIEFPGNVQGRSIRETGAKGCSVVTVGDDHSVSSRFEPLDVVRWLELSVEADDGEIESAVQKALQGAKSEVGERLLAVRLLLRGAVRNGQALRDRLDAVAVEVGEVWIEKIVVSPRSDGHSCAQNGPAGVQLNSEIREIVALIEADDAELSLWMEEFAKLRSQLIGELEDGDAAKALADKQAFRELVARVGGQL